MSLSPTLNLDHKWLTWWKQDHQRGKRHVTHPCQVAHRLRNSEPMWEIMYWSHRLKVKWPEDSWCKSTWYCHDQWRKGCISDFIPEEMELTATGKNQSQIVSWDTYSLVLVTSIFILYIIAKCARKWQGVFRTSYNMPELKNTNGTRNQPKLKF